MLCAALIALTIAWPPPAARHARPDKTISGQSGSAGAGDNAAPASAPEPATPSHPHAAPAVSFPHPIITEVLYAVPSGPGGDASKDGTRDAAGDEFIELVNPHDKPIQLFGYTLTDSQEPGKGQMRFAFPAIELPAGGVVVVFNGLNGTLAAPAGDSRTPPSSGHEGFSGALVFSMRNANSRVALGNSGDHVVLTAPDGVNIQRVWWNEDPSATTAKAPAPPTDLAKAPPAIPSRAAKSPPKPPLIDDYAPMVQRMSVTRDGVLASGRFITTMDAEHVPFSPGVYKIPAPPPPPTPSP